MPTIRYANPAGSDTAPYDTLAKGATDIQTVVDLNTAGDTIRATGTFTLAASVDVDINSGDLTNGYCNIIGVNSSDVDDGTYFVLDGNSAATNCIKATNIDYWKIKNMECKNAVSHGMDAVTSCNNWILDNVKLDNNGGLGIYGYQFQGMALKKFICINNTSHGIQRLGGRGLYGFVANNGGKGIYYDASTWHGVIIHDNGTLQYDTNPAAAGKLYNCIIDGWNGSAPAGIGVYSNAVALMLFNCRITNNATGFQTAGAGDSILYTECGTYGNTIFSTIPAGSLLDDFGGNVAMTGDGYVGGRGGGATENFMLTATAELRNTEMDIDGVNKFYMTAGFPRIETISTYPDTNSPVLTVNVVGPNYALLEWSTGNVAAEYKIFVKEGAGAYAQWPDGSTTFKVASKFVSGRTASTQYTFKVQAVNNKPSTADSNEVTVTMSPDGPILERTEDGIKTLLSGMTIANGYNFDWKESNQRDVVKVTNWPFSFVDLMPNEDNLDDDNGADAFAYHNEAFFRITAVGRLSTEENIPEEEIKNIRNKMLDDLKRLFGTNYFINANAGVEIIMYQSAEDFEYKNGDFFTPAALLTFWKVRYSQNRLNPTQTAV